MTTKIQAEFLAAGIISDQTQVSAADADHVLIFDASDNSLKKALVSTVGGGGSSAADDITAGDAAVTISTSSGNITIDNGSSDDDIIFKGTDGGSDITALTLDMSEAGKATFNGDVALGDSKKLLLGAGDDLQIYHDGSNSIITDAGTGGLFLRGTDTVDIQSALGHNYLKSTISAGTQIYYNNAEKFATVSGGIKVTGNIENASGDMTVDVAGDIILDADGGTIFFKDGGTEMAQINLDNSGYLDIYTSVQDADFRIRGNDGGSTVTALTLDMSDAGSAYFNNMVGIGTTTPDTDGYSYAEDLVIKAGASASDGAGLSINSAGRQYGVISFLDSSAFAGEIFYDHTTDALYFKTGQVSRWLLDSAGNMTVTGNVTAYGSVSDERLKENIEIISNPLDKVKQLKGITFNYKKDGQKSTGLIAQDLEKVLPEAVYTTKTIADEREGEESEEHLAIHYGNTVGLLVEAIKELSAKIEKLENK